MEGTRSEGADLAWVFGQAPGCTSCVEVICSDLVPGSEVEYLLPRARKATLARNVPEFSHQLSVMLAIGHDDPLWSFRR